MPITISTLQAVHQHGYVIGAYCRSCSRGAFLDLLGLIAAGEGARAIRNLPVRCLKCGQGGEISLI